MKFQDIKGLSLEELAKKKKEVHFELFQARMKNSLGQLGNPMQVRMLRRNIARLLTAQSQKQG